MASGTEKRIEISETHPIWDAFSGDTAPILALLERRGERECGGIERVPDGKDKRL